MPRLAPAPLQPFRGIRGCLGPFLMGRTPSWPPSPTGAKGSHQRLVPKLRLQRTSCQGGHLPLHGAGPRARCCPQRQLSQPQPNAAIHSRLQVPCQESRKRHWQQIKLSPIQGEERKEKEKKRKAKQHFQPLPSPYTVPCKTLRDVKRSKKCWQAFDSSHKEGLGGPLHARKLLNRQKAHRDLSIHGRPEWVWGAGGAGQKKTGAEVLPLRMVLSGREPTGDAKAGPKGAGYLKCGKKNSAVV